MMLPQENAASIKAVVLGTLRRFDIKSPVIYVLYKPMPSVKLLLIAMVFHMYCQALKAVKTIGLARVMAFSVAFLTTISIRMVANHFPILMYTPI